MTSLNYYDRLKAMIQSGRGEPPYFVYYFEHSGRPDLPLLRRAFADLLYLNREKLGWRWQPETAQWQPEPADTELPFSVAEGPAPDAATIENWCSHHLHRTIRQYRQAPVICRVWHDKDRQRFWLVYLFNHIHGDGGSGHIFYQDHCRMYGHLLDSAQPPPLPFDFLTDGDFLRRSLKGAGIRHLWRHYVWNFIALFVEDLLTNPPWRRPGRTRRRSARADAEFRVTSRCFSLRNLAVQRGRNSRTSLLYAALSVAMLRARHLSEVRYGIPINLRAAGRTDRAYGNHGGLQMIRYPIGLDPVRGSRMIYKRLKRNLSGGFGFSGNRAMAFWLSRMPDRKLETLYLNNTEKVHMLTAMINGLGLDSQGRDVFPGGRLLHNYGFNYPGQGHMGISLGCSTLGDRFHVSLAAMDTHMSQGERERFFRILENLLQGDGFCPVPAPAISGKQDGA